MIKRRRHNPARMRSDLRRLLAAHAEVDFAYILGSLAFGMAYYDLEVAVFLRSAPAPAGLPDYEMDLSAELTRALGVDVDVHLLNHAPRGLRQAALQGRPLLVRDQDRLADFIQGLGPEVTELAYMDALALRDVRP